MLNLDTHLLIYALQGKLRPREKDILGREAWGISAIVLWELSKLVRLGRIRFDFGIFEDHLESGAVHVWPITLEICRASTALDVQSDPADELIAATSIVHHVPLVTRDKVLRRSKMIPLIS